MKISLEALEALDAIDRHGSFAAAARQLNKVPSALSYTIQKLEQDLDALIFDRRGHRARLTEAGHALLEEGRHLLVAAGSLECRVRQVAKGWESELVIAVNALLPMTPVYDMISRYDAAGGKTRLRLTREVLSGCWDALADGRADLVIGASGDAPVGGGYRTELLGEMEMTFAVAANHPLADAPEPMPRALRGQYRAVVVADSSRRLPQRTVGLLSGQETLIVPDMQDKLAAQLAGLGTGNLPAYLAAPEIAAGRLVPKIPEEGLQREILYLAWRSTHRGRTLAWFREHLQTPEWRARLIPEMADPP